MKLIGRAVAIVFFTFMAIWFWPVGGRIWSHATVREARVHGERESFVTRDPGDVTHLLWIVRRDRFSRDPNTRCAPFLLTLFPLQGEPLQIELDGTNPQMRRFMAQKGRSEPPCAIPPRRSAATRAAGPRARAAWR